jgi:hypothetical protein
MRIGERRGLTEGEVAIARAMFEEELDLARVRIAQIPPLGFGAMVPLGETILFAWINAPRDFSRAALNAQGLFIHELTHCWQAARGRVLALAKLKAIGRRAYRYRLTPGQPFSAYNIEQQAEIVRHLFLARSNAPAARAPSHPELEVLWARRNAP